MTDDSPDGTARRPSRRGFLGTAATVGAIATAGCLGSVLDTAGSNGDEIEPEEPSDPRKGTPGEFYTLVERNDIPVESLRWDDGDLVLEYSSNAGTESESTREIEIITTVYNENLVKNGADVGMLYAEVANPFDGQAHGWGVKTEWCERYNEVVAGESGSDNETDGGSDNETDDGTDAEADDGGNESSADDTAENESTASGDEAAAVNQAAVILMSNVLNTRVYAEDLED